MRSSSACRREPRGRRARSGAGARRRCRPSDRDDETHRSTIPCGQDNLKIEVGGRQRARTRRGLRDACTQDHGRQGNGFGRARLRDNIPKMMFIFLPLIAGVMFVLYLGSRRYYVEHLVFFVHYHAFFFLAGIADPAARATRQSRGQRRSRAGSTRSRTCSSSRCLFYVPWYLYRAMRRVYGQGRVLDARQVLRADGRLHRAASC